MGGKMGQRQKLMFVYDADGSIGVVMEFSESDFEAYSMPVPPVLRNLAAVIITQRRKAE